MGENKEIITFSPKIEEFANVIFNKQKKIEKQQKTKRIYLIFYLKKKISFFKEFNQKIKIFQFILRTRHII